MLFLSGVLKLPFWVDKTYRRNRIDNKNIDVLKY